MKMKPKVFLLSTVIIEDMDDGKGLANFYFLFEKDIEWKKVQASIKNNKLELKCTINLELPDLHLQDTLNLDKDNMFLRLKSPKSKILIGGDTSKIYEFRSILAEALPKENITGNLTPFQYNEFKILKFFIEKRSFEYMKGALRGDAEFFNKILEIFRGRGYISPSNEITNLGIGKMKEAETERDILLAVSNGQFLNGKIADFAPPIPDIDKVLKKMRQKGLINDHNQMEEDGKKMLRLFSQVF